VDKIYYCARYHREKQDSAVTHFQNPTIYPMIFARHAYVPITYNYFIFHSVYTFQLVILVYTHLKIFFCAESDFNVYSFLKHAKPNRRSRYSSYNKLERSYSFQTQITVFIVIQYYCNVFTFVRNLIS